MKAPLLALAAVVAVTGCPSYENLVKEELSIPYVYMPPNNADHPYTLFMHTPEGNFLAVCDATRTTGLTEAQILAARRESDVADFGMSASESVSVKVGLSTAELGDADAAFSRIDRVRLTLLNGKVYTLPYISISEVGRHIETSNCGSDARFYLAENPDAKFYIATTIFGYDIGYRVFTADGVDVTARLPTELTRTVLSKAGVGYSGAEDEAIVGKGLYVGFRGTPVSRLGADRDTRLAAFAGERMPAPIVAARASAPAPAPASEAPGAAAALLSAERDPDAPLIDVTGLIRDGD